MSRAFIFKGKEGEFPVSQKMSTDPFDGYYGDGIIEPPYNLDWLARLPEHSNILGQCIEAMETNIDGFGFTLEPAFDFPEGDEKAEAEHKTIMHFFEFCNFERPYSQLRRRVRRDLEVLGNGYWEVIRDGKGDIVWLEHIEGHTMRLTQLDREYTDVTYMILDDDSNELQEYPSRKRFRRFVQIRDGKKVYFKEFGDPRLIDSRTGQVDSSTEIPATEIIHFKLYCPYSSYGVPRWIGNWLAVEGSRQAEEVNYEYFENNTVPPMALLVAGTLDDKVVERIEDFINDEMKGRKSFNKILIVEASPFGEELPGTASPKVSLQFVPLSDAQQKDSLFDNYDKTNREKIRSSFRLPPIFVGLTSDYTRATARESREVAEEQVFGPERADHDFVINRLLFPAMGVRFWKYKSIPPKVNDFEVMSGVLDIFSRCGMTVKEVREEISRLLNHPLSEVDEKSDWLNLPLQVYLAKQKNGEIELEKSASRENREALFLRSLIGIEKALKDEHEH
jgi:PBSX family phage portal protein